MPVVSKHEPGNFCWMEVGTTDTEAAMKFYGDLFGWTYQAGAPDSPFTYYLIQKDGKDLGGLYELMKEMREQGVPPHWMSYVEVENADAATQKIKDLGGQILMGPMDVMDHGRMSVAVDPTGAHFSIWQSKSHQGAGIIDEIGTVCWHELATRDTDRGGAFYTNLFGWKGEAMNMGGPTPYTIFKAGDTSIGGMMMLEGPGCENVPPHWMIYFSVADCDAIAARTTAAGGSTLVPPMDIPNIGRFSILKDPQGAAFAVIKTAPR